MFKRNEGSKQYDLEERTLQFAKDIRVFVKMLPRTIANEQDIRQLVRASGSVGANYIEANESLTTQRGIMATPPAALLRSWGRPSRLHPMRRKRSALPPDPSERGGPPPLVGLSPGLCGSVWRVAYFTHRTVARKTL